MPDSDGLTDLTLSRRDAIRGGAALGTMALASRIGAYAQVVEAQITEPRIQLGSDYAIHDNGGNLVINHDPNGDILVYDASADEITTLKPLGTDLDLSDNDITDVASLTTDDLVVNNAVSVMTKSDQSFADGSLSEITFDNVPSGGDELGLADVVNNAFQVPASPPFNRVRLSVKALWNGDTGGSILLSRVNGSPMSTAYDIRLSGEYASGSETEVTLNTLSGWIPVSGSETFTLQARQNSSGPLTMDSQTWFAAEAK